jgi:hypothetical protein
LRPGKPLLSFGGRGEGLLLSVFELFCGRRSGAARGAVVAAVEPWLIAANLSSATLRPRSDFDDARLLHISRLGGEPFSKKVGEDVKSLSFGGSTGLVLRGVAGSPVRGVVGLFTSLRGGGGGNGSVSILSLSGTDGSS